MFDQPLGIDIKFFGSSDVVEDPLAIILVPELDCIALVIVIEEILRFRAVIKEMAFHAGRRVDLNVWRTTVRNWVVEELTIKMVRGGGSST